MAMNVAFERLMEACVLLKTHPHVNDGDYRAAPLAHRFPNPYRTSWPGARYVHWYSIMQRKAAFEWL